MLGRLSSVWTAARLTLGKGYVPLLAGSLMLAELGRWVDKWRKTSGPFQDITDKAPSFRWRTRSLGAPNSAEGFLGYYIRIRGQEPKIFL